MAENPVITEETIAYLQSEITRMEDLMTSMEQALVGVQSQSTANIRANLIDWFQSQLPRFTSAMADCVSAVTQHAQYDVATYAGALSAHSNTNLFDFKQIDVGGNLVPGNGHAHALIKALNFGPIVYGNGKETEYWGFSNNGGAGRHGKKIAGQSVLIAGQSGGVWCPAVISAA